MSAQTLELPGRASRRPGVRPLLLGEAPSPDGDPNTPLGGRIGARLCNLMGWEFGDPYVTLSGYFETWNVIPTAEDAEPWDRALASHRWAEFLRHRLGTRDCPTVVVAFGRRAAEAIGARDRPFFEWRDGQLYDSVVLPHPSGRNRAWNDPRTTARVRTALAAALIKTGRAHE